MILPQTPPRGRNAFIDFLMRLCTGAHQCRRSDPRMHKSYLPCTIWPSLWPYAQSDRITSEVRQRLAGMDAMMTVTLRLLLRTHIHDEPRDPYTHRSSTCRRLVLLVYYLYCANAPGEVQYSVHRGFRVITSSLPSCIPNVGVAPHPMIMMLYGSFHSLLLLAVSGESSVHKPRRTCVGVLTVVG